MKIRRPLTLNEIYFSDTFFFTLILIRILL